MSDTPGNQAIRGRTQTVRAGGSPHVLFCRCEFARVVPAATREAAQDAIRAAGIPITVVQDLCEKAALRDPATLELAGKPDTVIAACHPRAVRNLLRAAGVDTQSRRIPVLNMRTGRLDTVLGALGILQAPSAQPPAPSGAPPPEWQPWFPVIDYDLCVGCRLCVDFCPFGVYSVEPLPAPSSGTRPKVLVTSPRNCKNECPACARMCPHLAIIFPKFSDAPINGAEVTAQHAAEIHAKLADQKKALASPNIKAILASRRARAAAPSASPSEGGAP